MTRTYTSDGKTAEVAALTVSRKSATGVAQPEKRARAWEMLRRRVEISRWLDGEGPEPDPDWKPEHPPRDEAERLSDLRDFVERFRGGLR